MKQIIKIIAYTVASIMWLIFLIMFICQISLNYDWWNNFDKFYYIIYAICIFTIFVFFCSKTILCIYKPLIDKLNARKEQRARLKAERAEEEKQARIAELEAELEELKKD